MGLSLKVLGRELFSISKDNPIAGILKSFEMFRTGFKKEPNTAAAIKAQFGIYWICIRAISNRVSTVMREYKTGKMVDGKFVAAPDNHIFNDLRRQPNPMMSGRFLDSLMTRHILLAGKSFVLVVPRETMGKPIPHWLWPLEPARMTVAWDGPEATIKFVYLLQNGNSVELNPKFVMWPREVNTDKLMDALGSGQAMALEHDTDRKIWDYERHMFETGLFIRWIIKYPEKSGMTTDKAMEIATRYGERARDKEKTEDPIVVAGGVEVDSANLGNETLDIKNLLGLTEDRIMQGFGVPRAATGKTESLPRANIEGSLFSFNQNTIDPMCAILDEEYERIVFPLYDQSGGQLVGHYPSPVPKDKEHELMVAEMEIKNFITSVNGYLEEKGRPSVDWGDRPWGVLQQVQINEERPVFAPLAGAPIATVDEGKLTDDTAPGAEPRSDRLIDPQEGRAIRWTAFIVRQQPFEDMVLKAIRQQLVLQDEVIRKRIEKKVPRFMEALIMQGYTKKRMAEELEFWDLDNYASGPTKPRSGIVRTTLDDITNMDEFHDPWVQALGPILLGVFEDFGTEAAGEFDVPFSVDPKDIKAIGDNLKNSTSEVLKTSRKKLRATLQEGFQAGEGADTLARRVREVYETISKGHAKTIARTETIFPANQGSERGWTEAGVSKKEWITTLDGKERHAHTLANGQIRDIDKPFNVDNEPLRSPGDPRGSAGNIINCRCASGPLIDEEFEELQKEKEKSK